MASQQKIDEVGQKFAQWATSLPEEEQQVVADWMNRGSDHEVQGYSHAWWQNGESAWSAAWNESWAW